MDKQEFWDIFEQTGEPLAYVLYSLRAEETRAPKEGEPCSSSTPR